MPDYTQENRLIAIDTPLGKDVLLLNSFTGQETRERRRWPLQDGRADIDVSTPCCVESTCISRESFRSIER